MYKFIMTIVFLILVRWAIAQLPSDNQLQNLMDSAVHTAARTFFADSCHVGLSMAVYSHGNLSFYNYGTVNKNKQQLPTNNSIYEIGSVTKTFTGSLLAKAILENKVQLDEDIRR